ncbi:hypothetical protein Trydic_g21668 [Trypoxylus dichotomus]
MNVYMSPALGATVAGWLERTPKPLPLKPATCFSALTLSSDHLSKTSEKTERVLIRSENEREKNEGAIRIQNPKNDDDTISTCCPRFKCQIKFDKYSSPPPLNESFSSCYLELIVAMEILSFVSNGENL